MDADGVLARDVIEALSEDDAPWITEVRLFSDARPGAVVHFRGNDVAMHAFDRDRFRGVDIALLGGDREVEAGAVAVRVGDVAPTVLTELDPEEVDEHSGTVCVPDGPATAVALVCRALDANAARVVAMHPASTLGPAAIEELYGQHRALFNQEPLPETLIGDRLAFNVLLAEPGCVGLETLGVDAEVTPLMLPLFGGTMLVIDVVADLSEDAVRSRLDAMDGLEVFDEVQPATIVGEPTIRVAIASSGHGQVRCLAVVDEVRRVATSLVSAAREIALRDAF